MPHTKKKAGTLSLASAVMIVGFSAVSSGMFVEAGVLFAIATGLFIVYEYLNLEELTGIDFTVEDAEAIADNASDVMEDHRSDE